MYPIKSFGNTWYDGERFDMAIGIRADEIDRINEKADDYGLIYPLVRKDMIPTTKPMVNFYWSQMPFRLELKGYQGNCATCWKKSDKKLYQIAKENPKAFDFMRRMEAKYGRVGYEFEHDENSKNRTFFRKNRSSIDILEESKRFDGVVIDDSKKYDWQLKLDLDIDLVGGESCEVFSECGDI